MSFDQGTVYVVNCLFLCLVVLCLVLLGGGGAERVIKCLKKVV